MATILYVEDYPPNAMLVHDLLTYYGEHEVLIAEDGVVGYEMAMTNQFDLLIVDMQMPRMSGWELIPKLLGSPSFRKVPIVTISALSPQPGIEPPFRRLPHLSKPIQTRTLHRFIARLLEEAAREGTDEPE
ncbi:MAG: response regulator [Ardenticatenales bacterium]|nr:response regulator [Ardenticatenales bacterium]